MEHWKDSTEVVVSTGCLHPLSPVGCAYKCKDMKMIVMTWRGDKKWVSTWDIAGKVIKFISIESPDGMVINWGSRKSLKRFIPLRHIDVVREEARKNGKKFFEWELEGK